MTEYLRFTDTYGADVVSHDGAENMCWLRIRGGELSQRNDAIAHFDIPQAKQLIAGLERFVCQNEDSEPAEPASDEDGFFSSIERLRRKLGLPNSARNWQIMLKAADELGKAQVAPTDGQSQDRLERLTAEKNQLQALVEAQEAQLRALSQQAAEPGAGIDWWRDCWLPVYINAKARGESFGEASAIAHLTVADVKERFPG